MLTSRNYFSISFYKKIIGYILVFSLKLLGFSNKQVAIILNGRFKYVQIYMLWLFTKNKSMFLKQGKGKIIIYSIIPSMSLTHLETFLGMAFKARGYDVEYIFDDGIMPLNELTTEDMLKNKSKEEYYKESIGYLNIFLEKLPLKKRFISQFISINDVNLMEKRLINKDRDDLIKFTINGINIGMPALMTALRHFRLGYLTEGRKYDDILKKYIISAYISLLLSSKLIIENRNNKKKIKAVLMSHGIYSSWESALNNFVGSKIYTVVYDRQPGKDTYQFNVNTPAQSHDISRVWFNIWKNKTLTNNEKMMAINYYKSRENYENESIKFSTQKIEDDNVILSRIAIQNRNRKIIFILFSNLVWDAAAVGKDILFPNTINWIKKTIDLVKSQNDSILIIKPHPAEKLRGTKTFVSKEVKNIYHKIPNNVRLLDPDVNINPYSLMNIANIGIVHTSTAGLEMAVRGKPVITVSSAHYRGKGFTYDPKNLLEYKEYINNPAILIKDYDDKKKELALKYFYIRYFKYQHKLPFFVEKKYLDIIGYKINSFDDLLPGKNKRLDFILESIIKKRENIVMD